MTCKIQLVVFLLLVTSLHYGFANDKGEPNEIKQPGIEFIPNQNQFHKEAKYKAELGGFNKLFITDNGLKYILYDGAQVVDFLQHQLEHNHEKHNHSDEVTINGHSYDVHFIDGDMSSIVGKGKQDHYYNYFLGDDTENWASKVPAFSNTVVENIYHNINLSMYSKGMALKYDFIVNPGGNPDQIMTHYEHVEGLYLEDGNLYIETSIGNIQEMAPFAYQIINGIKKEVACHYAIDEHTISYKFPDGYDKGKPLVIDPVVVGATLSGVNGFQIFGHTAAFDAEGNMYNGGTSFGEGLQWTPGAFDATFNGGLVDIALHKYNTDGSSLIYGTYLGGNSGDHPHSIFVDDFGQLHVLGSSDSDNFPISSNAFQNQIGGNHDIIITKLNADASDIIGSTYVGGSRSDGRNLSTLFVNYGEEFRGEIVLDNQGNIYIASCSSSTDFPISENAFQPFLKTLNPLSGQDGVVFKMNSDLSTMFWGTYIGSSDYDMASSLRVLDNGEVVVTGTVGASDFLTSSNAVMESWPGGVECAYVTQLNSNGTDMVYSTFWGASGADHSYFLDTDTEGNIHIFGQTTGGIEITPNTYFTAPGAKQFLTAFSPTLEEVVYSTVIGTNFPEAGSSEYDFVPVAFMVDKCNSIYFSGYYANNGLPTTSDAILNSTFEAFYLGVLDPKATGLQYATYYGNSDHVDGGTSRFDKAGIVYQGVCSCTGGNIMNTSSNAYAQTQSSFCDMGIFKIDFEIETVTAKAIAYPGTSGCLPFEIDFTYTGSDGENFFWDFGDGSTSTQENPSYTYTSEGNYTVTLIASSEASCNISDTFNIDIAVLNGGSTFQEQAICVGNTNFIDVTTPGATYAWYNGNTSPTILVNSPGIYWVDIMVDGCAQRDSFNVISVPPPDIGIGNEVSICDAESVIINATSDNVQSYLWSTGETDPIIEVFDDQILGLTITDVAGCIHEKTIEITIGQYPMLEIGNDTTICDGNNVIITPLINTGALLTWQDGSTSGSYNANQEGLYWAESSNGGCKIRDSLFITIPSKPNLGIDISSVLCAGDCNGSIMLGNVDPTLNLLWEDGTNSTFLSDLCPDSYNLMIIDDQDCTYDYNFVIDEPDPLVTNVSYQDIECYGDKNGEISFDNITGGTTPYSFLVNNSVIDSSAINTLGAGDFEWVVIDNNGCSQNGIVNISEPPKIEIYAGTDTLIKLGEEVELDSWVLPKENKIINWDFLEFLSCGDCESPVAFPVRTTTFTMNVTDEDTGCELEDEVTVRVEVDREVYVPNVFSPNDDSNNDFVSIFGGISIRGIESFKIFDRWGELVFEKSNFQHNDHTLGWDGTFNGEFVEQGVYVFLAEVVYKDDYIQTLSGTITVLR